MILREVIGDQARDEGDKQAPDQHVQRVEIRLVMPPDEEETKLADEIQVFVDDHLRIKCDNDRASGDDSHGVHKYANDGPSNQRGVFATFPTQITKHIKMFE